MEQKVSRIGIWHNLARLIMPSRVGLAFGIWHFPLGNAMPCQGHAPPLKNQPRLANHYAEIFSTRRAKNLLRELIMSRLKCEVRKLSVTSPKS
jgi:hypothetical protein